MKSIVATFFAQTLREGCSKPVNTGSIAEFDVTSMILDMPMRDILAIEDGSPSSDKLRTAPDAPPWVKKWSGTYRIEVEDSIRQFFFNCCTDLEPPEWLIFNAIEVHPMTLALDEYDHTWCEPAQSGDEPQFWTVFGHLFCGGLEAITDVYDQAHAERIGELFRSML